MSQVLYSDLEALVKGLQNIGQTFIGETIIVMWEGKYCLHIDDTTLDPDYICSRDFEQDDWDYCRQLLECYNSDGFWEKYDSRKQSAEDYWW